MIFHVFYVYLVYNSALLLAFCYSSFLLYVKDNLICIFFDYCQLVLLSYISKFLYFI